MEVVDQDRYAVFYTVNEGRVGENREEQEDKFSTYFLSSRSTALTIPNIDSIISSILFTSYQLG